MNKLFKLTIALISVIIISAAFVISHGSHISNGIVTAGTALNTGTLDDGMKKAMIIARDELQDDAYSTKNSN